MPFPAPSSGIMPTEWAFVDSGPAVPAVCAEIATVAQSKVPDLRRFPSVDTRKFAGYNRAAWPENSPDRTAGRA